MKIKSCKCEGNGGDLSIDLHQARPQGFTFIVCNYCRRRISGTSMKEAIIKWNEDIK